MFPSSASRPSSIQQYHENQFLRGQFGHHPTQTFQPRTPGAGEHDVQIEILFCGVCHSDVHTVRNEWQGTTYPCVPGHEIVGRLTKVGAKVHKFKTGDIAGVGCLVDSRHTCGSCGEHLLEECGFDAIFNYKTAPVLDQLKDAAPDGIDVYFDNVGGDSLEAALTTLRVNGRIIACGGISGYNNETLQPGPSNLFNMTTKRLTMKAMIVGDWLNRQSEFEKEVGTHYQAGKLKSFETVVVGLDQAADAFIDLFKGRKAGKMVVNP